MMDDATYVNLSSLLRKRRDVCVRSLISASREYGEADYNAAMWGNPHEWPETDSAAQDTLGCILYKPQAQPGLPPVPQVDYPCVFLEYLDGAFSVKSNPGIGWKKHEHASFVPFNERIFHRKRGEYADFRERDAMWILVGDEANDAYSPKGGAVIIRCGRMTPDALAGVSLHADLTWNSLDIQFIMNGERKLIRLPEWGLKSYLQQVDSVFTDLEDLGNVQSMLTGKTTRFRISEDKQEVLTPDKLKMEVYVNKLRHIIPRLAEGGLRLTGWFCSELLQELVERLFCERCESVEFGYPYQSMKFA